jgi:hypothetical protein
MPSISNVDHTAAPIEVVVQPTADPVTDTERKRPPPYIDNRRIIRGHVHEIRAGWENLDRVILNDHLLLGRALKAPGGNGLATQILDGQHDLVVLVGEGHPKGLHPFGVVAHLFERFGIMSQRLDRRIPVLGVDGRKAGIGMIGQPLGRRGDVIGIRRGRQQHRQQRVGV